MKSNNKLSPTEKKQALIGLAVIFLIGFAIIGGLTKNNDKQVDSNSTQAQQQKENQDNKSTVEKQTKESVIYTITGEIEGEYGKKVVLNKNSDMPATKYLYKLPAGTYKVTTTFKKMVNFFIVKDQIKTTPGNEYPEEIDVVGSGYMLTAGDDDFNGHAKKEVNITLKEDESIQIVGNNKFFFEKH